ncbi:MAG TPA: MXAN_5187 C-terminal domain-containing protein [Thermoanaerobaculia bacterium]|nr:MXAN_5187 C-terminal domain-containing protein [Thermoanaerobaculia bacterium]
MIQPDEIDVFEESLRVLKNKYDQFFAGIRRLPPTEDRRRLDAMVHELSKTKIRDNGRRFRLATMIGRLNMYRELWSRRMREREEGPIEFRKRAAAMAAPLIVDKPAPAPIRQIETSTAADPYVKVTPEGSSEAMQQIFSLITSEQRRIGKETGMTLEQVTSMVQRQTDTLRERYQVNAIAFRVETIDGKVKLKAKPVQP